MAIYFNNKILEPKPDGNSLERRYHEELKEVKKTFDLFRKRGETKSTLIFTRDFNKVWNSKKTTYKPAPPIALPLVSNIYVSDMGSVQIRYSKEPPLINDRGRMIWRTGSEIISDIKPISEDEMDLAWFIIHATSYLKRGIIKLVNKKVEFDKDFSKMRIQAKPYAMLFSEDRTEEELLNVVSNLFPPDTIKYENGISELAVKIWETVRVAENVGHPWGYAELEKAIMKEINKKADKQEVSVISVKQENGKEKEVAIPLLKAPINRKKEDLIKEAGELGIEVNSDMTNNFIYSLIQAHKLS